MSERAGSEYLLLGEALESGLELASGKELRGLTPGTFRTSHIMNHSKWPKEPYDEADCCVCLEFTLLWHAYAGRFGKEVTVTKFGRSKAASKRRSVVRQPH